MSGDRAFRGKSIPGRLNRTSARLQGPLSRLEPDFRSIKADELDLRSSSTASGTGSALTF